MASGPAKPCINDCELGPDAKARQSAIDATLKMGLDAEQAEVANS